MKTCRICNETKDLTEFYKRPSSKDGRRTDCKECLKTKTLARGRDPEVMAARVERAQRRHNDPVASAAARAKARAWRTENGRTPERLAARSAYNRRYIRENPHKQKAHRAVLKEVDGRRMRRASDVPCESASTDCYGKHDYHHDSYLAQDRLNVRALCQYHHKAWHKMNKTIEPDSIVAET